MAEHVPQVGDRYVATDNHAAAAAMELPRVPMPLLHVTVSHVYPDHEKVRVNDGDYWLTFAKLAELFRRLG